jgi:hypothetical protein
VAVDVQLEFGLRQLLLDGNTADWADLELLLLFLGDLVDGGVGALLLLLLDLDGLLQLLLLLVLLLLLLLLLWSAQSQGGQLVLQLVQELLNALQGWLLLLLLAADDLLNLDRDQRLLDERGGHRWQ